MSILSEILNEEYERLNRTISSYEAMAAELPKGSLRKKRINGREYAYLQWRDGKKIKSKYIKSSEKDAIAELINRRRQYEREIRSLNESKKQFDKVVGREL
jgi:hypothetical protein